MEQIIFNVIDAIIATSIPIVFAAIAIPVNKFIKTHHLEAFAARAVRYAEQALPANAAGEEKYKVASKYLVDLAAKAHINVQGEDVTALIESAVSTLKTQLAIYADMPAQDAPVEPAAQASTSAADMQKVGDLTLTELKQALGK